ncbi:hypothetical protein BN997_00210 [Oceanobacillus oncorhynchi]|uniref:Polymerase/histidinol phosphatase N-terminal domain-containing protein n=1 Tax=Oceanobacillus oncorhynchi TaxID=545501 RepID=A0A0A1ML36_9BACI|nr:CehA/McbA family metallohydrolase [Oceanobacillus oncorhynchi]CEI80407.1 hypothetical protein BN997_00210 [Oceanobacillus oncorhynchi]
MKIWKPFELHTHTFHSDGKHSLLEMVKEAKMLGLQGLALTDHNTMSGLIGKEEVESQFDINIISGLEWTTFYGHMNMLGVSEYIDWREFTPKSIHTGIKKVHDKNGIVGIVHPYRIGSPICTGCFWEYHVEDWTDIDYIEVWSGTLPSVKKDNRRAFHLWTEKLNEGYQITAVNGRDWHETTELDDPIAATFLKVDKVEKNADGDRAFINAIKHGEVSVSMGPLIDMTLEWNEQKHPIGGEILIGRNVDMKAKVNITVDYSVRERKWELEDQNLKISINSNKGMLNENVLLMNQEQIVSSVNLEEIRWLRAELYGVFNGVYTMIAFTNAIYVINTSL